MESIFRGEIMKVLLHGCNGRMGQVLAKIISESKDMEVACGVDISVDRYKNPFPVYNNLEDVKEAVDVLIDFSNHLCLPSILEFGKRTNTPLVICTTGFTPEEKESMTEASKSIPVFNSANMSIGINLLISLVKQAAKSLYGEFDIEIIEKHHNMKIDSPSGTALMIADAINEEIDHQGEYVFGRHSKTDKRKQNEIGIHAVRGGSIVGEHQTMFAGPGEIIEINHTALSRDVFAYGAVRAAKFMVGKKTGFYTMKNVLE